MQCIFFACLCLKTVKEVFLPVVLVTLEFVGSMLVVAEFTGMSHFSTKGTAIFVPFLLMQNVQKETIKKINNASCGQFL